MNEVDRLKTLARILLSALEENQQFVSDPEVRNDWLDADELTADNEEIIRQAHEVLLDFPA